MGDVLIGFASLAIVVAVGYVLARTRVVGGRAADDLSRIVFAGGTPALMFTNVADAPVGEVLSIGALVTVLASALMIITHLLISRFALRIDPGTTVIGALSSGYVNAGNLGIPILTFVVGSAAAIAPVLLWQLLILVPLSFTALDQFTGRRRTSVAGRIIGPLLAPPVVGVLAGLVVSITGFTVPTLVAAPVEMLAQMAVPAMLIAFGLSLHRPGDGPREPWGANTWLALVQKTLFAPLVAWGLGLAFGLEGTNLLAVVTVSALPTAQNVFVYAMRYSRGISLTQHVITWSTVACVPITLLVVELLG